MKLAEYPAAQDTSIAEMQGLYKKIYTSLYTAAQDTCIAQSYIRKYYLQVYIWLHRMHAQDRLKKKIYSSLYMDAQDASIAQTYIRKYIQVYIWLHKMHAQHRLIYENIYKFIYGCIGYMHSIDLYKLAYIFLYMVAQDACIAQTYIRKYIQVYIQLHRIHAQHRLI